jgi:hypothetical protein
MKSKDSYFLVKFRKINWENSVIIFFDEYDALIAAPEMLDPHSLKSFVELKYRETLLSSLVEIGSLSILIYNQMK